MGKRHCARPRRAAGLRSALFLISPLNRCEAWRLAGAIRASRQPADREVTAEDVAQAFLHQALELKTIADVTAVDGGNIAAAMR